MKNNLNQIEKKKIIKYIINNFSGISDQNLAKEIYYFDEENEDEEGDGEDEEENVRMIEEDEEGEENSDRGSHSPTY